MIHSRRPDTIDAIAIIDPHQGSQDLPFSNPPAWLTDAMTAGLVTWTTGPPIVSVRREPAAAAEASGGVGDSIVRDPLTGVIGALSAASLDRYWKPGGPAPTAD